MSDIWYNAKDGNTVGPVRLAELKNSLCVSKDWKDVLVWQEGWAAWKAAGEVPELKLSPPPLPLVEAPVVSIEGPSNPTKQKWTLGRIIVLIGGGMAVLFAIAVGGGIGREFGRLVSKEVLGTSQRKLIQTMSDALSEINKTLPRKIDDATTLRDVSLLDRTIVYHYLIDTKTYELQSNFISARKDSAGKSICTKEDVRKALQFGFSYNYRYIDSDGKLIGSFSLVSADCP